MHTLRGVAIEGGAIIATDQNGTSFRVEVDDTLRSRLRESATAPLAPRKLSPREIQTQIRAGMSADEVAKVTGAPLDYIQRYEGPVLAERQYVVESALGVPVRPLVDDEPDAIVPTFGGVMGERLLQLSARGTHWSSWKEEAGGWVLKLSFAADSIDHDARWRFDPKKLILSPLNAEAVALSQQGEIGASLLPRLRAVPQSPDSSRFDSGAFEPLDRPAASETTEAEEPPQAASSRAERTAPDSTVAHEPLRYGQGRIIEPRTGAISVAPEKSEPNETSDLLEALRRRRGEREASSFDDAPRTEEPVRGGGGATVRVLERTKQNQKTSSPGADDRGSAEHSGAATAEPSERSGPRSLGSSASSTGPAKRGPSSETMPIRPARRGRTSMPSWDEIVFGARADDEDQ